jgi:hypothetical protein
MASTAQFELPLVAPAQAQKHVTVNEALARLDAVAQLRVTASALAAPPAAIVDGASYLVPEGATGAWSGQSGRIAIGANGGWVFLAPKAGWQAWDESTGARLLFDGAAWIPGALAASAHGAATIARVLEFDHPIVPGSTNSTAVAIPTHAQVIGVTGRVIGAISGSGLTGWRVGVAGADNRYGSGLGLGANSYLSGLSGSPVSYYAATPLLLSGEGGAFAGGIVRLAVHLQQLEPPRAV